MSAKPIKSKIFFRLVAFAMQHQHHTLLRKWELYNQTEFLKFLVSVYGQWAFLNVIPNPNYKICTENYTLKVPDLSRCCQCSGWRII